MSTLPSLLLAFSHWFGHYGIAVMVLIFLGIFITTYWPSRKASLEQNGLIPLEDDNAAGPRTRS